METELLPTSPTATSVPSLLNEKCLGADPPAAAICTHCKDPSGIGLNVTSESDGPLGVSTDWSQRFDTVINFLSGCNFCDQASVVGQISNYGGRGTYREHNFSGETGGLGRAAHKTAGEGDLAESHAAVGRIADAVARNGVREFAEHVHEDGVVTALAARRPEHQVTGSGARLHAQRRVLRQLVDAVFEAEVPHQVCAQVRHHQESAGRVHDCLVRMRLLLAVLDGPRSGHGKSEGLEGFERTSV